MWQREIICNLNSSALQGNPIEGAMNLSNPRSPSSADEIRSRYVLLTSSPVEIASLNAAGELVEVLLRTHWAEITLIRCPDAEGVVDVEVEVSIPLDTGLKDHELLTGMVSHLMYLKHLVEKKFMLTIIREDCLWVACRTFSTQPEMEVFDALLPP